MHVAELIKLLQEQDQDAVVVMPYANDPEYYVPVDKLFTDRRYDEDDAKLYGWGDDYEVDESLPKAVQLYSLA